MTEKNIKNTSDDRENKNRNHTGKQKPKQTGANYFRPYDKEHINRKYTHGLPRAYTTVDINKTGIGTWISRRYIIL